MKRREHGVGALVQDRARDHVGEDGRAPANADRCTQPVRFIGFTHPAFIQAAGWSAAVSGADATGWQAVCGPTGNPWTDGAPPAAARGRTDTEKYYVDLTPAWQA